MRKKQGLTDSKIFFQTRGYSTVEVWFVLIIIAILASLAFPSSQDAFQKKMLQGAVETYISHLKYAHTEAMKSTRIVFVSISPGVNWCYGLSDTGACNCQNVNQCLLNGIETRFDAIDFSQVSVALNQFTQVNGVFTVSFDPIRGTASHTGTAIFTLGDRSVSVSTTRMGIVNVCSNQLTEYSPC